MQSSWLAASLSAAMLLSGCALGTAIDTSRVKDECIQHAYSRNIWWPNWDRVSVHTVDANGGCQLRQEIHTVTARESFGQGAGKAAAGALPLAVGLSMLRVQQSTGGFTTNEHFTTKCVSGKCF